MSTVTRYQVITNADQVAPNRRRRDWLQVGYSMVVEQLMLLLVRDGDQLWLDLFLADGTPQCAIPLRPFRPGCLAPHHAVIPRAIRFDYMGRPEAVLLETQYHGNGLPCWTNSPNAMEGNHAEPNHPTPGV